MKHEQLGEIEKEARELANSVDIDNRAGWLALAVLAEIAVSLKVISQHLDPTGRDV